MGRRNPDDFAEWIAGTAVVGPDGKPARVFHATNADVEGQFHPYTHFGTADAANDRAQMLRDFSVDVVGRDPGAFRLHPVYLAIKRPLRMPDLADVDSDTGLSMSDAWERFFNRNDMDQETWDELSDEEREEFIDSAPRPRGWEGDESVGTSLLDMGVIDMDEFEEKGRRNEGAFELLAEKGYDGIVYENVVEAPGSESWINFRGDQVRSAVRRMNPVDPASVACPVCQAAVRERCDASSRGRFHRLRQTAAAHAAWQRADLSYEDFTDSMHSHQRYDGSLGVKKGAARLKTESDGTWHRTGGGWRKARRENPSKKREKVYPAESLSDDDRQRLARPSKSGKRMLGPLESEDCGHGKKRLYRWSWDVDSSPEDSEPDVVQSPNCKVCYPDDDMLDNPKRRNSDERLRELERRWRATGDSEDFGRWAAELGRVLGQDPWEVGLSREHARPRAARGELWEASIRAGEQPVRTVFFGYDGSRMAFTAQLEALASPASYSRALEVLKGLSPNVEFAFVAHPEASPVSFRLILPSGRLAKAVLRPTETEEGAKADGLAAVRRTMEFFHLTPSEGDDWWRPWNPANYPSMEAMASEISSRLMRANPSCRSPRAARVNPRLKTYAAAPGSLLHVRIVAPDVKPRAKLVVEPMIPERPLAGEDDSTPRVCLAPHLGGCLAAIEAWNRIGPPSTDGYDQVVVYENAEPVEVVVPSRRLVGDAPETGEVWALGPVRLRRIAVADQDAMQQEISDVLDDIGRLDRDPDVTHSLKAAMVDEMLGIEQEHLGR